MKRLLLIAAILGSSTFVHAAWSEFYMVTTGSDTNSGSTTDDVAPVVATNGSWGTAGILNRFVAASGTPFSGVVTGSFASVYFDTATAAVFVSSVIAVNGGGSSIDLDTTTIKYGISPSTAASARSCKIGGAWGSLVISTSLFSSGTAPLSTRINVKAGTYANTTNVRTVTLNGTGLLPVWWRGYKTTPGDQDTNALGVAGVDIPNWTFTTGSYACAGAHNFYSNINVTSAANSINGTFRLNGSFLKLYHVRIYNTNATANGYAVSMSAGATGSVIEESYIEATTTSNNLMTIACSTAQLLSNIISGGIDGIGYTATTTIDVRKNLFLNQADDAIQIASATGLQSFDQNTFYNIGGNGINIIAITVGIVASNNLFVNLTGASKACINNTSGTNTDLITITGNSYFNVTNTYAGITENFTINDNTVLTTNPLKRVASGDYTPFYPATNSSLPNYFETLSIFRSYTDPGAVQHLAVTGGSWGVGQ